MKDGSFKILAAGLLFSIALGGVVMAGSVKNTAVVVVDVQADFTKFKNGSLAVEGTDAAYITAVKTATEKMKAAGYPIFATQDWHPANHASFYTNHPGTKAFDVIKLHGSDQVLWPPHCVQKTSGADILLDKALFKSVFKKGMDAEYDSYSGIKDDGGKMTKMDPTLKKDGIKKLIVYGIATDYCVRATALDAAALGYKVLMIKNLSRGVAPETSQKAIDEMTAKGVVVVDDLDLEKIKGF
jgi:nicotinamidase/pyrazinamidase